MATSLPEITTHLAAEGLSFRINDEKSVSLGFQTDTYRNVVGEATVMLVIELTEAGEYVKIFAPNAFDASGEFSDVFLRACAMVQWKTKLIQFEFDVTDGEIRPIVEFPLEDAPLTQRQLMRCVHGLVGLLDQYYTTLHTALHEGVIRFEKENERQVEMLSELLSTVPPEILAEALRIADERRRTSL